MTVVPEGAGFRRGNLKQLGRTGGQIPQRLTAGGKTVEQDAGRRQTPARGKTRVQLPQQRPGHAAGKAAAHKDAPGRRQGRQTAGSVAKHNMKIRGPATAAVLLNVKRAPGNLFHGVDAPVRQQGRRLQRNRAGTRAYVPEYVVRRGTQQRKGRRPHGRLGHEPFVRGQHGGGQTKMRTPGRRAGKQQKDAGRAELPPGRLLKRTFPATFPRKAQLLENMRPKMRKPAIQQQPGQRAGRRAGVGKRAKGAAPQRRRKKGMHGGPPVQGHGGHVVMRKPQPGAGKLKTGRRGVNADGIGPPAPRKRRADTEEQGIAVGEHDDGLSPHPGLVQTDKRRFQRRDKRKKRGAGKERGKRFKRTPAAADKRRPGQQGAEVGRQGLGRERRGKTGDMDGSGNFHA